MRMGVWILTIGGLGIIFSFYFLIFKKNEISNVEIRKNEVKFIDDRGLKIEDGGKRIEDRKIEISDFPFTVQAPTGEWDNPVFQDGCEEATALMAKCSMFNAQCSIKDGIIDKEWAREEIIKMTTDTADTSAKDTAARILAEYFKLNNYEVKKLSDKSELKSGVWIVPMDGTKLGNPYYTAPGPERHMVLVIGYDAKTDELITNDPGTKRGKGYRYKLDVFWNAIRDYPTGEHEPITKIEKRGIFVKF